MTAEPLNPEIIRDVTLLPDYVSTTANKVGSIERGLKFGDDEPGWITIARLAPFIVVQLVP